MHDEILYVFSKGYDRGQGIYEFEFKFNLKLTRGGVQVTKKQL